MTTAIVTEDATFSLMARCTLDGAVGSFLQAAITSITWKAYLVSSGDGSDATNSGSLTVSSVVYDTLQADGRWVNKKYPTGYNFRHDVAATEFTTPGLYRIEHLVTPSGGAGDAFFIVDDDRQPFIINVKAMWTS